MRGSPKSNKRKIFAVASLALALLVLPGLPNFAGVDGKPVVTGIQNNEINQKNETRTLSHVIEAAKGGKNSPLHSSSQANSQQQEPQPLFHAVGPVESDVTGQPWVLRQQQIEMSPALLSSERFRFTAFSQFDFEFAVGSIVSELANGSQFTGDLIDGTGRKVGSASVVAVHSEDGIGYSGRFSLFSGETFLLQQTETGAVVIEEVDTEQYPNCGADEEVHTPEVTAADSAKYARGSGKSVAMRAMISENDAAKVRVLVLYTPQARAAAGGVGGIEATIVNAVAVTNLAYRDSEVNMVLELAHTEEVSYNDTNNFGLDLTRLQGAQDGYLDNIHAMRDAYEADLVALITNGTQYCGIGYLMASPSPAYAAYGFSVVARACSVGYLSFAHELGHNMGAHHDPVNAGGSGAYNYSYGFHFANDQYRTIMAYAPGTRVGLFSNPNVTYNGYVAGAVNGNDNARTLNNTAEIVASYRGDQLSLSGYISQAGVPLAGVVVDGGHLGTALTDASGQFTFGSVPEGTLFTLSLAKTGYSFSPSSVSGEITGPLAYTFDAVTEIELLAIPDQTISRQGVVALPLVGSGDLAGITFSTSVAEYSREYQVKAKYGLTSVDGQFKKSAGYLLFRGRDAKVFQLRKSGKFYSCEGESCSTLTFIEKLGKGYYDNPNLLISAVAQSGGGRVSAEVSGSTLVLTHLEGPGSYVIQVSASRNGVSFATETFVLTVENRAPGLKKIKSKRISADRLPYTIRLKGFDADGDVLSYSATVIDSIEATAYDVSKKYRLTSSYSDSNRVYFVGKSLLFMNANGKLYDMEGKLIAKLSPAYFSNPSGLLDSPMTAKQAAKLKLKGSRLTVKVDSTFSGKIPIEVLATDGAAKSKVVRFSINVISGS